MTIRPLGVTFVSILVLAFMAGSAVPASASEQASVGSLAPHEVVAAQLEALQHNDEPSVDAGIATVWSFAHPAHRLMTGPLERFTRMIHGDTFRILIDHSRHTISEVVVTADSAVFAVAVFGVDGVRADFLWEVRRLPGDAGEADTWRTIRVSPAENEGEEA